MRTVNIGLVGSGTVGGGFISILQKHHDEFLRHQGVDLNLAKATTRTLSKLRRLGVPEDRIVESYRDIIEDPAIDIVVELVGGVGFAADVVLDALNAGKTVVTANKALMATHGKEIFDAAEKNGVEILFEASVGGGIPIIQPMKHQLTGNEITSVLGIVNGTTNYMLTRMEDGLSYDEALKEAQERGFAEADPTADVEGQDAAAKIAILSSIAFNSRVVLEDVYTEGISTIKQIDLHYAKEMGYRVKLLAIAHKLDDGIDVRVHPTMIPESHQLASVSGVYNAIYVTGDAVGDCMFFGEGAGAGPAASAVMGDVIEAAKRIAIDVKPLDGCTCTDRLPIRDVGQLNAKFYLRIVANDERGVLAAVSRVFADNGVSIRSMIQPTTDRESAELIFMTHHALEANVEKALTEIEALASIKEIGTIIRVEEE